MKLVTASMLIVPAATLTRLRIWLFSIGESRSLPTCRAAARIKSSVCRSIASRRASVVAISLIVPLLYAQVEVIADAHLPQPFLPSHPDPLLFQAAENARPVPFRQVFGHVVDVDAAHAGDHFGVFGQPPGRVPAATVVCRSIGTYQRYIRQFRPDHLRFQAYGRRPAAILA